MPRSLLAEWRQAIIDLDLLDLVLSFLVVEGVCVLSALKFRRVRPSGSPVTSLRVYKSVDCRVV